MIQPESPVILSENPVILSKNPAILSKSPVILSENPDILSENPDILSKSPAILSKNPVILSDLSLCIPRVFSNVTWRDVKHTFEFIIGTSSVERVDIIPKTTDDGTPFNRAFIHLRFWPKNNNATNMRHLLNTTNSVKIVYNDPWFWKVSISRISKPLKPLYTPKPPFIHQGSCTPLKPLATEKHTEPEKPNKSGNTDVEATSSE